MLGASTTKLGDHYTLVDKIMYTYSAYNYIIATYNYIIYVHGNVQDHPI